MNNVLNIIVAQINPIVGNIPYNLKKIIEIINNKNHNESDPQLIIFPEFALTGYPLEDLLFNENLKAEVRSALNTVKNNSKKSYIIIGHPDFSDDHIYNSLSIFFDDHCIYKYNKQKLPNYSVFDEQRYFCPGKLQPTIFTINNYKFATIICEDLWHSDTISDLKNSALDVLICINASPYYYGKNIERINAAKARLAEINAKRCHLIYANLVGGQDELLFDGSSFVLNYYNQSIIKAGSFKEQIFNLKLGERNSEIHLLSLSPDNNYFTEEKEKFDAIVLALRDYVKKNNFSKVILGLSGGIDSALTLCIAAEAIGSSNVHAVIMPSRFNAKISTEDALIQARNMNVSVTEISIDKFYTEYLACLKTIDSNINEITSQNIQARIRGNLLMALSNQKGGLVISTSNKSESAVGYCTLYGDMAGGFAPIKDLLKTEVYKLANYYNTQKQLIPIRVINRPPSAELSEAQTDQDTLPPYDLLDQIIMAVLEHRIANFQEKNPHISPEIINHVIKLIKISEFKRHQAPPGPKITKIAFGKDRRYPVTNGFNRPLSKLVI